MLQIIQVCQQPMLYPNQAIPAPVYTNLSELKRAATRKFQKFNDNNLSSFRCLSSTNLDQCSKIENGVSQLNSNLTSLTFDTVQCKSEICSNSNVNSNPGELFGFFCFGMYEVYYYFLIYKFCKSNGIIHFLFIFI